jgi:hypothetical protein
VNVVPENSGRKTGQSRSAWPADIVKARVLTELSKNYRCDSLNGTCPRLGLFRTSSDEHPSSSGFLCRVIHLFAEESQPAFVMHQFVSPTLKRRLTGPGRMTLSS